MRMKQQSSFWGDKIGCSDGGIICDYTKNHWTVWFKLVICSGSVVKNLSEMQETRVWSLGQEDPLTKGMATHSSILVWRISWTEEPGGLQSMGSQRVGHNWVTKPFHFPFHSVWIKLLVLIRLLKKIQWYPRSFWKWKKFNSKLSITLIRRRGMISEMLQSAIFELRKVSFILLL